KCFYVCGECWSFDTAKTRSGRTSVLVVSKVFLVSSRRASGGFFDELRPYRVIGKKPLKICHGAHQAFLERDARLPAKQLLCQRNVRLALLRIILWKRTMHDL